MTPYIVNISFKAIFYFHSFFQPFAFRAIFVICIIKLEDMKYYSWAMFTHVMDFFKECVNLKKSIPEHFFTSLLNDLLIKDLVTLGNFLSTKFMKPRQQLYVILSK